jgi:dihydrolipoamide dehydrogenase
MQNHQNIFTTDEALAENAKLYKRILISGGGVIGVEFASIYSDFGCEVTIVGSRENLLRRLDNDISKNIMMLFKKRGINIITPAKIQDIQEINGELVCEIAHKEDVKKVACDGVLVCIGRAPLTDDLFMDGVNIDMEDGFVVINEHMQTSIPNIYAIGDCTKDSTQLAHAASAQGLNAVSHIMGEEPAANMLAIPSCVYTSPEIATVGLLESEAEQAGFEVKTSKYLMSGNGKSMITNEDRGFMKLVFDAKTDVIIGAHLMCARATDIISELTCAIANKLTAEKLASVIRPHPTYVEGISEAVEDLFGTAIHMAPKKK